MKFLKQLFKSENILGKVFRELLLTSPLWAVALIIALLNFNQGKILTGWDNLHPEYGFGINISRSLSAVWQEYQGLGLLGGMAHAADLPRQIILAGASEFVSILNVRWLWTFAMLILGPLGLYNVLKSKTYLAKVSGGLLYLLNLATLQYFFTPFEVFISFYGFLPWLVWSGIAYLNKPTKGAMLRFILIGLFGSSAFYVQTMFFVFCIVMGIFCLEIFVSSKTKAFKDIKNIVFGIFLFSAFWLMPIAYFSATNINVVEEAKINKLATPDTKYMNQAFSSLENVALIKGFWFDYLDLGKDQEFGYLFEEWRGFVEKPEVKIAGYSLFGLALLGIVVGIFQKDNKFKFSVAFIFLLSFFMLAFPLTYDDWPIIGQIFRSPFTKWSGVLVFCLSLGFANLADFLWRRIKIIGLILFSIGVFAMGVITLPFFQGKLISTLMVNQLPAAYFELFEFMKEQPKQARMVHFPINSFWGWHFYDWGYRGSGFLWHGIEQPIIDRSFDVWSKGNEQAFLEISYALQNSDWISLNKVINKYDISYILFDESIIIPGQDKDQTHNKMLFEAIAEHLSGKLVFKKDHISVFKVNEPANFVFSPETIVEANSQDIYKIDPIYLRYGDYTEGSGIYYPFSDLAKEQIDEIITDQNSVAIKRNISPLVGQNLIVPKQEGIVDLEARVSLNKDLLAIDFDDSYQILINGDLVYSSKFSPLFVRLGRIYEKVAVRIGESTYKVSQGQKTETAQLSIDLSKDLIVSVFDANPKYRIDLSSTFINQDLSKCWEKLPNEGIVLESRGGDFISISVSQAVGCKSFPIGQVDRNSALISVNQQFKSSTGTRPHFCVTEEGSANCITDDIFYHSYTSREWNSVSRDVVVGPSKYWFVLSARAGESDNEWEISYREPDVSVYPQIAEVSFSTQSWAEFASEKNVLLDVNDHDITIKMKSTPKLVELANYNNLGINCDLFKRGSLQKSVLGENVYYQASQKAAICDYITLWQLGLNKGYLLQFTGEGISGRALKFYLFKKNAKINDFESILSEGKFVENIAVLPWQNKEGEYILNLETRSFGDLPSETRIDEVKAYSMPWLWLFNFEIKKTRNNFGITIEVDSEVNSVEIFNVQKTGSFFYSANINSKSDNGTIVLSQGFDKGWVAFSKKGILKHKKFNNWANGWIVPEGEYKITIIYWPQFLQYMGFLFLAVGGYKLVRSN